MGGGRDEPAPGDDETAEPARTDAPDQSEGAPSTPGTADRADTGPAGEAGPEAGKSDGEQDEGPGHGPDGGTGGQGDELGPGSGEPADGGARSREALLLSTGYAAADAESLEDVLRALSRLHTTGFPLEAQVVFRIAGRFLNSPAHHSFLPGGIERTFRIPMTTGSPATEVARTGRAVYVSTPEEYRRRFPATYPLAARKGPGSWAFLPLAGGGRVHGVWLATFSSPVAFTADERALLTVTSRLVARALERTSTDAAELALSRGLRSSMDRAGPSFAGMSVAARYIPAGGGLVVGGDWYDSIELPSGRLALVIGDVQGHDVHAAGLMTQLRTAVHAYAAEGHGPDAVLARASYFLTALDPERFATCLYLEVDPLDGGLQIARAGHPHPVLRMPDGTCLIKHVRGGLPLGLMPGEDDYPVTTARLHDGEVLLLCTDGLIETGGHDLFSGWLRLRDALSPGPVADLEGMADRLIRAVSAPEAHDGDASRDGARGEPRNEDDIALLLVRRDAAGRRPDVPERRLLLTLEQDRAEGVSEARSELESLLHDWTRPDQIDTAVLLTSELLGNVLVHTDQAAALTATLRGEPGERVLRVEVTDQGDELPHQRAPGEMASSGRGLVLLDLLSDKWGVRPEPAGKTVWFSLSESGETTGPADPLAAYGDDE